MRTPDHLLSLASRVEEAEGADRFLDAQIAAVLRLEKVPHWARLWTGEWRPTEQGSVVLMEDSGLPGPHFMAREYTASLDAALTLLDPDAFWRVGHDGEGADPSLFKAIVSVAKEGSIAITFRSAIAATPALALTAACLKARAHAQDHSHG
jgi:hypothetical protein